METGFGANLAGKGAHAAREGDNERRSRSAARGGSHGPQMILALAVTETLAACAVLLIVFSVAGVASVLSIRRRVAGLPVRSNAAIPPPSNREQSQHHQRRGDLDDCPKNQTEPSADADVSRA